MTPLAIARNIETALADVKEQLEQLDVAELPYVEVTNRDVYRSLESLSCVYFLIENGRYKQSVTLRWKDDEPTQAAGRELPSRTSTRLFRSLRRQT